MSLSAESDLHITDTGSGEPVLLLHSSGLSGRQWRRLASDLVNRGMRAIVPDLSGHGASPPWPEPTPFSFRTDVERVSRILAATKAAHVIGHSYGGLIALHAATAAPLAVRSLSLFDPVAFGVLGEVADAPACAPLSSLDLSWGPTASDRERWLRTFVDFWGGDGAWSGLREDARTEFRRVAWVVREGVRTLMDDKTSAREYAAFPFPVRLVTGALSPLPARRVAERLHEAIGGPRVTVIDDAGHLAPITHPEAVNRVLLEALEGP
jgi:pimeloyl-ACP methyl ester carboxylesterase